jgi:hypothetical protein
MAALIQIVVAGGLLVAWVWLLGRPGLGSAPTVDSPRVDEEPGDLDFWGRDSSWRRFLGKSARIGRRWWDRPVEARRRQLMLATMIATFVSFFLAIALRDRFVFLFVMMLTLLVAHVVIASRVGANLVEAQRRSRATEVAERRAHTTAGPEDIRIGDAGVVTLLGPEDGAETIGVTSYVSDLIDQAWSESEQPREPVTVEARPDLAAQLEWADDAPAEPSTSGISTGEPPSPETPPEPPAAPTPDSSEAPDLIFTRAAKDAPARARRKPKPIHIDAELDDDIDLTTPSRRAASQN